MGRLIILTGPSCVGKGPLVKAFKRFHPELAEGLQPVVLYNDRAPRPGEADGVNYHFRPRAEIEKLRHHEDFLVMEVRSDLQAMDGNALRQMLERGDAIFEGNPFIAEHLLRAYPDATISIFLAPLSREEILTLKRVKPPIDLAACITDVMRRKLLRRTTQYKGILSLPDLENVERRAQSACRELQMACRFGSVIVNHDGEDSEHWDAFPAPLGDARKAMEAFASVLEGSPPPGIERWEEELLPASCVRENTP